MEETSRYLANVKVRRTWKADYGKGPSSEWNVVYFATGHKSVQHTFGTLFQCSCLNQLPLSLLPYINTHCVTELIQMAAHKQNAVTSHIFLQDVQEMFPLRNVHKVETATLRHGNNLNICAVWRTVICKRTNRLHNRIYLWFIYISPHMYLWFSYLTTLTAAA